MIASCQHQGPSTHDLFCDRTAERSPESVIGDAWECNGWPKVLPKPVYGAETTCLVRPGCHNTVINLQVMAVPGSCDDFTGFLKGLGALLVAGARDDFQCCSLLDPHDRDPMLLGPDNRHDHCLMLGMQIVGLQP